MALGVVHGIVIRPSRASFSSRQCWFLWTVALLCCSACVPREEPVEVEASPYRAIVPRLSAAVPYAPCEAASAELGYCRNPDGEVGDLRAALVSSQLRGGAGSRGRSPEALHDSAVERVLRSEDRAQLGQAFAELEDALLLDGENPAVLNDLAAVYHIHASSAGHPWHRVRALELVGRAHRLAPRRPFVAFNRALFHQALGLRYAAEEAWNDYLLLDQVSPWADEARDYLAKLGGETRQQRWLEHREAIEGALEQLDRARLRDAVVDFPLESHDLLRDELLPRWAEWKTNGEHEKAARLATGLRALGDLVVVATDARLIADAVEALDASRPELLEGLELFGRGRRLYELDHDWTAAEPLLEDAAERFAEVGHPLEPWSRFFAIVCRFQGDDGSLTGLDALPRDASQTPLLASRIEQLVGIAAGRRQEHGLAIAHYERAGDLLIRFGEDDPAVAFVRFLRGEALANLGHRDQAWRDIYPSLRALIIAGEPRRLHSALAVTARGLMELGLAEVALPFYDELVAHARAWGEPYALVSAHQGRAMARHRLTGETTVPAEDVLADLESARAAVETIDDARFRRAVLADLAMARAEAGAASPLDELAEARRFYRASQEIHRMARLRFLESRALAATGELDGSRETLADAIELYEELLQAPEAADEPRYLPEAEEAFRRMVALELEQGRLDSALAVAERSRRLPGRGGATAGGPSTIPDTLEFFLFQDLDDRLVVFHGLGGKLEVAEIPVAPQELGRRIRKLHFELLEGDAETTLEELYTLLLGEPFGGIDSQQVVIVPDRSVTALPFAALRDPQSGSYLVEQAALAVAPSLDVLARSGARLRELEEARPSSLVVGDPEADSSLVRYLAPLPNARREAEAVSALYSESMLLTGRQASRDRWLVEAPRHGVLHYAGHSSIDPLLLHRSVLHLAPPLGEPSGDLSSAEIRRLAFPDTRLVVLSSCSSSLDHSTRRRVPGGLADAFLAAGVPTVIGALWPIDDEPTSRLMLALHEHLVAGLSPVEALRQTQLDALGEGGELADPWVWSAFRLTGGMEARLDVLP